MSLEWDKLYKLGTDVAGLLFFHPARLAHRQDDPTGWWGDDFAKEFRAGRLIAFGTGSAGTFTLKFVRRPLTDAEERVLVVKMSFRYEVQDGRLFWDNASCLPCQDQGEDAEDDESGWLELPNGLYRVTVHALDWFTIPAAERQAEGDISHYVVRFEPVTSFKSIRIPKELPWLLASKSWHEKRLAQQAASASKKPAGRKKPASKTSAPQKAKQISDRPVPRGTAAEPSAVFPSQVAIRPRPRNEDTLPGDAWQRCGGNVAAARLGDSSRALARACGRRRFGLSRSRTTSNRILAWRAPPT